MLQGWLIVNGFLQSAKFAELYDWLISAAATNNIDLRLIRNNEILIDLQDDSLKRNHPAFVIFWDKDIRLAELLEQNGLRLFNCARAIELCDDKGKTHLALKEAGLSQPHTIVAPKTFTNIGYTDYKFIDEIIDRLGLPLIVKHCVGSFGGQVFLASSREYLVDVIENNHGQRLLFQKYITASGGSDLRLQVVGDKVIGAIRRSAEPGEFRANLTLGGSMETWQPDEKQTELALEACRALGLDFAGVDILTDETGQPLICEVNSNAHFKTLFDCTEIDAADLIMKYILKSI